MFWFTSCRVVESLPRKQASALVELLHPDWEVNASKERVGCGALYL
jgi:hypothetical protein